MPGKDVDNTATAEDHHSPNKDPIASLQHLTPEQIQKTAATLRALLEVNAQEAIRQEQRRQVRESLLMQAYTIKAFRVSLENPKKNITFEKMMAYSIEQMNIASRLFADYFNFLSPGSAVSTVHDLENSLHRMIDYCTETVTLPNGIQQVKLIFSFQVYTECAEMIHRLEVAHDGARSIFRHKDETLYKALSQYAGQLKRLVRSMQFQARNLPKEADLIAQSTLLNNTAAPSLPGSSKTVLLGQFASQLFPQLARQEVKAAPKPKLKGMAARELTAELQLEQTATPEMRNEAVQLLESFRGERITALEKSQVFRYLGQIKTQADVARRTVSVALTEKAEPAPLPMPELASAPIHPAATEGTAPVQRASRTPTFFFTAQNKSDNSVLLRRSHSVQGSSAAPPLERLDSLFPDETWIQGQQSPVKL